MTTIKQNPRTILIALILISFPLSQIILSNLFKSEVFNDYLEHRQLAYTAAMNNAMNDYLENLQPPTIQEAKDKVVGDLDIEIEAQKLKILEMINQRASNKLESAELQNILIENENISLEIKTLIFMEKIKEDAKKHKR